MKKVLCKQMQHLLPSNDESVLVHKCVDASLTVVILESAHFPIECE